MRYFVIEDKIVVLHSVWVSSTSKMEEVLMKIPSMIFKILKSMEALIILEIINIHPFLYLLTSLYWTIEAQNIISILYLYFFSKLLRCDALRHLMPHHIGDWICPRDSPGKCLSRIYYIILPNLLELRFQIRPSATPFSVYDRIWLWWIAKGKNLFRWAMACIENPEAHQNHTSRSNAYRWW